MSGHVKKSPRSKKIPQDQVNLTYEQFDPVQLTDLVTAIHAINTLNLSY